jgi:hypothetical protein
LTSPPLARFKGIPCNFANPIFLLCIYPIESSFPSVAEALST